MFWLDLITSNDVKQYIISVLHNFLTGWKLKCKARCGVGGWCTPSGTMIALSGSWRVIKLKLGSQIDGRLLNSEVIEVSASHTFSTNDNEASQGKNIEFGLRLSIMHWNLNNSFKLEHFVNDSIQILRYWKWTRDLEGILQLQAQYSFKKHRWLGFLNLLRTWTIMTASSAPILFSV